MPPDGPPTNGSGAPNAGIQERGDTHGGVAVREAPPPPAFLQAEPAAVCDLDCRMCLAGYRRDTRGASSPFLNPAALRRLLEELPGLSAVHLQGLGEPFLHPHFLVACGISGLQNATQAISSHTPLKYSTSDTRLRGMMIGSP